VKSCVFIVLLVVMAVAETVRAEPGVSRRKIVLGQSCALEGPAAALGQGMSTGLNLYFDHLNSLGGIKGRKIALISKNDSYDPTKAVQTTLEFLMKDEVFLLIGGVGTETSEAVLPVVERMKVPFIAPFTGSELLRTPPNKWVVNVRGSFNQEMEKLAVYLADNRGLSRIACFYRDDAYGAAGLSAIELALGKRGLELVGSSTFTDDTPAIENGVADIGLTKPDAVVMVGEATTCADLVMKAKSVPELQDAIYCSISFVGTQAFKEALGDSYDHCIASQVVPYPWDESLPLVKEYNELMTNAGLGDQVGFVTLEGFMAAKLFCQVMEEMSGRPTREKFIETLHKVGSFDLGGVTLTYGPEDNQGMDQVFIVEFVGDGFHLAFD
jgi:ABC-type branched-subunit amino acid transport system substrate-binding protein